MTLHTTRCCGDGKIHAGVEACDDGNTVNGDGCSSTCRTEGCGNGVLDPGEECDDGNAVNTDACVSGCRIAVCGDGFVRIGVEQCDDGNLINGDGCSNNCRSGVAATASLDPGEQCDDGNMISGDGCSSSARSRRAATASSTTASSATATAPAWAARPPPATRTARCASCGDGKVNSTAGEQCDSGTVMGVNQNADNADCTAACKINICTDGKKDTVGPNHFEACDDGNTIPTDGCSNNCTLASCGNGVLDPGEECDDDERGQHRRLRQLQTAKCGNGFVEAGVEECDGAPVTVMGTTYNCSATCKLQRCGNGIINPSKGEQCDNDISMVGTAPLPNDGCNSQCKIEFCGDGVMNNSRHEDCDSGTGSSTAESSRCNKNCTNATAATASSITRTSPPAPTATARPPAPPPSSAITPSVNGGCSGSCQLEKCGNGNVQTSEAVRRATGKNMGMTYPCYAPGTPLQATCSAAETARWTRARPASRRAPPRAMRRATTVVCGDHNVESPRAVRAALAPATCNGDCSTSACGDGKVNPLASPAEQCDGGPQTPAQPGPREGDGHLRHQLHARGVRRRHVNATAGEECDNGANNGYDKACLPNCKNNVCGDGFLSPGEMCDYGTGNNLAQVPATCPYATSCMVCPMGCTSAPTTGTAPTCGDGATNGPETGDNGGSTTNEPNCAYNASATPCARQVQHRLPDPHAASSTSAATGSSTWATRPATPGRRTAPCAPPRTTARAPTAARPRSCMLQISSAPLRRW